MLDLMEPKRSNSPMMRLNKAETAAYGCSQLHGGYGCAHAYDDCLISRLVKGVPTFPLAFFRHVLGILLMNKYCIQMLQPIILCPYFFHED